MEVNVRKTMGKLVRDKIPEIILKQNIGIRFRILEDEEYAIALESKLDEEVQEFKESHNLEELVDILTVVYAIAKDMGVSVDDLHNQMNKKIEQRGNFNRRIYLDKVFDGSDD